MKNSLLLGAIAAVTLTMSFMTGNGLAQPADNNDTAEQKAPARPKFETLRLDPLPAVKTDDVSDLLEIKMWKFEVSIPARAKRVQFVLEEREKDKEPTEITSTDYLYENGLSVNGSVQIFVGTYPIPDLEDAPKKVKYMMRRERYLTVEGTPIGYATATSVIPDKFDATTGISWDEHGQQRPDGGVTLIYGSREKLFKQEETEEEMEKETEEEAPDVEITLTARVFLPDEFN